MRWLPLLLVLPMPALAESWVGPAQVVDGDTIRMEGNRLRLLDMDAFESAQTCSQDGNEYSCGTRATEALQGLIGTQTVRCSGQRRDRYGRPLVTCHVGDLDLSGAMVRSGWAVAEFSKRYSAEEAVAREAKLGGWAGTFERPRVWRKANLR